MSDTEIKIKWYISFAISLLAWFGMNLGFYISEEWSQDLGKVMVIVCLFILNRPVAYYFGILTK